MRVREKRLDGIPGGRGEGEKKMKGEWERDERTKEEVFQTVCQESERWRRI